MRIFKLAVHLAVISAVFALAEETAAEAKKWRSHTFVVYDWSYVGKKMANGKILKADGATVATYAYPLGAKIELDYRGRKLLCTVTDRPPRKHGQRIEVPPLTWKRLTGTKTGKSTVKVRRVK